jgi:hypothetical protein
MGSKLCIFRRWWWLDFLFPSSYNILQFTRYYQHSTFEWDLLWLFLTVYLRFVVIAVWPPFLFKGGCPFCSPKIEKKKLMPLNLLFSLAITFSLQLILEDDNNTNNGLRSIDFDITESSTVHIFRRDGGIYLGPAGWLHHPDLLQRRRGAQVCHPRPEGGAAQVKKGENTGKSKANKA